VLLYKQTLPLAFTKTVSNAPTCDAPSQTKFNTGPLRVSALVAQSAATPSRESSSPMQYCDKRVVDRPIYAIRAAGRLCECSQLASSASSVGHAQRTAVGSTGAPVCSRVQRIFPDYRLVGRSVGHNICTLFRCTTHSLWRRTTFLAVLIAPAACTYQSVDYSPPD